MKLFLQKYPLLSKLGVICGVLCLNLAVAAAPAMVSIPERVEEADLILQVRVDEVLLADFNHISKRAHLHLSVDETLKGKNAPASLNLAFLVFPETVENHLREPVPEGRYIVFLKRKKVRDGNGLSNEALVMLEPRHFAFVDYSEEIYKEIKELLE